MRAFAPAKINFFLNIEDVRPDNYHNISTLMIPLRHLGDELTFSHPSEKNTLSVTSSLSGLKQEDNLVWKAARAFYEAAHISPNMAIHVKKEIPVGAGLGGGSSDAATTLMSLNQFYDHPLKASELMKIGSTLGSDIPFFFAKRTAYVRGKGDHVEATPFKSQGWFLILNPGFQISTLKAYQMWDEHARPLTKKIRNGTYDTFFTTVNDWMKAKKTCKNDFGDVIFPAFPILKEAQTKLKTCGAEVASLSGSGPTLFGLFSSEAVAQKAAEAFHPDHWLKWTTQGD